MKYIVIALFLLGIGTVPSLAAKNCAVPGTVSGKVPCGNSTPTPINYEKNKKTGKMEATNNDRTKDFIGGRRR